MSNIINYVAVALFFVMNVSVFTACGQTVSKPTNNYTMRPDSPNKPEMRQIIVRLKGDKGISIVDLITGKVIARNFAPYVNSQGKVVDSKFSTPVIDDMFCIFREKTETEFSTTVYQNVDHPQPIPGLTNLFSAQIVNPNLFPVCKYGERIKFVDRKGNVKFTVMPIDGKEPRRVNPVSTTGLFLVEVGGNAMRYGAIDATGKWVVYPDYNDLESFIGGLIGRKGDKKYIIDSTGKAVEDKTPAGLERTSWIWPTQNSYFKERIKDENGNYSNNFYDSNYNYFTTIDADYICQNSTYSNIVRVNRNSRNGELADYLVDLSKNCAVVSKKYSFLSLSELPDGNYIGRNDNYEGGKKSTYYYVKSDGTETFLYTGNQGVQFPIWYSLMALFYTPKINRFIVTPENGTPGYIIDFNGRKVGDLMIEEFLSISAKWNSVYSHYYYEKYEKKGNQ